MGFWKSEVGEITGDAKDAFAGSFKLIPDNTRALAEIASFANAEYQGETWLEIDWHLVDGELKGAKVRQKIKVFGGGKWDKNPEQTKFRALNMLKLIYNLAGKKPSHAGAPQDMDLAVFQGFVAGIVVQLTEPMDNGKQYNWVSEVHDKKGFVSALGETDTIVKINVNEQQNQMAAQAVEDDDVPF